MDIMKFIGLGFLVRRKINYRTFLWELIFLSYNLGQPMHQLLIDHSISIECSNLNIRIKIGPDIGLTFYQS